jgi:hypothetical protein
MEINYNGRLNLKISLDASEADTAREAVASAIGTWGAARFEFAPTYHPGGKVGKSKTIASFDVGLANERDALRYQQSPEETRGRLLSILRAFYGGRDDLGNASPPTAL